MLKATLHYIVTVNLRLTRLRIDFQEITGSHGEVGIGRETVGVNIREGHSSRLVSRHLVVAELVNPRIQGHSVLLLAPEHMGEFRVSLTSSLLISSGNKTRSLNRSDFFFCQGLDHALEKAQSIEEFFTLKKTYSYSFTFVSVFIHFYEAPTMEVLV